ncbi:MAG: DUF4419 domain-containing protein [Verrucomicrobiota bacterium]
MSRATTRIGEVRYRDAVERMVGGSVESCSNSKGTLVGSQRNGLIAAVNLAFHDHRPLTLSPDHIWLTICQGVSNHINANAERLRRHFVNHEGKAELRVRRDDFVRGAMGNPWPEVWPEFVKEMRAYIGSNADKFMPSFSTTGVVEQAACEVTLMEAMKNYFHYVVETLCGIPQITLEGSPEDWAQIRERAKAFGKYDLEWWVKPLDSFLGKLHETSLGQIDQEWWRSFYKWLDKSGGADVSGHILNLFPYIAKRETGRKLERNPIFSSLQEKLNARLPKNPAYHGTAELLRRRFEKRLEDLNAISSDAFPPGVSKAPFVWEYLGRPFDYEFLAGFVGVRQLEDLTLRPEIGWAVRPLP